MGQRERGGRECENRGEGMTEGEISKRCKIHNEGYICKIHNKGALEAGDHGVLPAP